MRTLGPHLAEMDRLLHDIQAELVPDREPRPVLVTAAIPDPPAPPPPPPPAAPGAAATAADPGRPPPPPPEPALDALTVRRSPSSPRLLASMRELLAGYERVLRAESPAATPGARPP